MNKVHRSLIEHLGSSLTSNTTKGTSHSGSSKEVRKMCDKEHTCEIQVFALLLSYQDEKFQIISNVSDCAFK